LLLNSSEPDAVAHKEKEMKELGVGGREKEKQRSFSQ